MKDKKKNIKFHIKKGDTVKILSGNDRGNVGTVLSVDRRNYRAIVEGENMIKKHTKPNSEFPDGGIVDKEASIHISNLMYVDAAGTPSRIGRKVVDNKIVRYSKKTGDIID